MGSPGARGGKLDVNIDSVRLSNGQKVALRAVKNVKGGSHTGAMTGAMVATGIVFFPAAPLFLFKRGKDITINKTGFIAWERKTTVSTGHINIGAELTAESK